VVTGTRAEHDTEQRDDREHQAAELGEARRLGCLELGRGTPAEAARLVRYSQAYGVAAGPARTPTAKIAA
jgi:hypothetical protein